MQLEWEAAVVQYVNFVWEKTQLCSMEPDVAPQLSDSIPLLGPHFMPPTYLHASKWSDAMHADPVLMYLCPLNIIHPFYYPDLAKCPCCEGTNVIWEGWTGSGACEVHGLKLEEVALGYQLQCKDCRTSAEAHGNEGPGYSWATTSPYFWHQHKHKEIPRELNQL